MVSREKSVLSVNEKILVVDDDIAVRDLTAEILTLQGYSVLCASNAAAALDMLKRESISIVVSDVVMSGIDGFQLVERIKLEYPGIKILLVSGYNDCIAQNMAVEILNKPFRAEALVLLVSELLRAA